MQCGERNGLDWREGRALQELADSARTHIQGDHHRHKIALRGWWADAEGLPRDRDKGISSHSRFLPRTGHIIRAKLHTARLRMIGQGWQVYTVAARWWNHPQRPATTTPVAIVSVHNRQSTHLHLLTCECGIKNHRGETTSPVSVADLINS